MPRPQRARPAPTRLAKATKPATAPAPKPDSQSNATSSDIYDVSDREKEKAAARRKSLRNSTSAAGSHVVAETLQQAKSLERTKQRRDAAMERLANVTSTDSPDEERAEAADGGEPGRAPRVEATPLRRRPAEVSGLDLDDSIFDDYNTTVETLGPGSAQRSAETSMMSVSQFRRRPRAGSFLSREDGPIRPGSRAGVNNTPALSSTLNFGVFKRRAREPSILSTARKPRPQHPEPEQDLDDDAQDEDDDDDEDVEMEDGGFAPEAESTPLRRSKRMSGRVEPAEATSSTKSRKRKSTETHQRHVRSSPFKMDDDIRDSIEKPASDDESPLSSPPSLSQHQPSTPIRAPMDPSVMAPPLSSSSSEDDEELWPPLKSIPKTRTRQPAPVLRQTPGLDDASDMSSPPSLTHSPNYAHSSSPPARTSKPKRKAVAKPPPKLNTADLTELLPRRRRRPNNDSAVNMDDESEPDVDISGLGVGEDELAHMDVRTRRRPASQAQSTTPTTAKARASTRGKDKSTQGPNKRISRTYGKISDKENEDQDEDEEEDNESNSGVVADADEEDSEMVAEKMGEELTNAVRKFQEVDKWELSFEERARSSSPLNAR